MTCINIQDIDCNCMNMFFSAVVDLYLFYDGTVDMQIQVLLTGGQCRVSRTSCLNKIYLYISCMKIILCP